MADTSLAILCVVAASIGVLHTITGPDHYVPFIAMSRVGRWSWSKTMAITLACGVGHVAGSVILGFVGIGLGLGVGKLELFESFRGEIAAWLLLGFGLAYTAWALRQLARNKKHAHWHAHTDGTVHNHEHGHHGAHAHVHTEESRGSMTPWVLFLIFVFGPCEPLIPLLMYPAAQLSFWGVALVVIVFGVTTLATMSAAVIAGVLGLKRLGFGRGLRYAPLVAGLAVTACGLAMQLGL